jgi:hypothetical protein
LAAASKGRGIDRSSSGAAIFPYKGEFDFHDAAKFCVAEIMRHNKKAGYPVICCMDREPVQMHVDAFRNVTFSVLTHVAFWALLTKLVSFRRNDGVLEKVPEDVARYVHQQAWEMIPQAPQVCHAPRFLADGSLLISSGYVYHPNRGINYFNTSDPKYPPVIPEKPTKKDVERSLKWLDEELLSDFAFHDGKADCKDFRAAGRANSLAMLFTPHMRKLFGGISPLFLIQKANPGEGATLLAVLSSLLSEGRPPNILRATKNEEEFSKCLTAAIREGGNDLFMDDVTDLNSKDLHRNLTSSVVSGRLLGSSAIISRPNEFNWVATGINPSVKAESARRIVNVRLDSQMPDPSQRTFRHPDQSGLTFSEFVAKHRIEAIGHILTLIQYWIEAGQKPWTKRTLHSYAEWARAVGGVLAACGVEGFLDHAPLSSHDPEAAAQSEFAAASFGKFATNSTSFEDLLKFHEGREAPIIRNVRPADLRHEFLQILMRLNKRTFKLPNKPNSEEPETWVQFVVSMSDADSGMFCAFSKVDREKKF